MIYRLEINDHLEDHMQGWSSGVQNKVSGAMSRPAWMKKEATRTSAPQVEGGSPTNPGKDLLELV